jgi:hypothetical protein
MLITQDSVHQKGSRLGRGIGFGRKGWLVFRGWWIRLRWGGWRFCCDSLEFEGQSVFGDMRGMGTSHRLVRVRSGIASALLTT